MLQPEIPKATRRDCIFSSMPPNHHLHPPLQQKWLKGSAQETKQQNIRSQKYQKGFREHDKDFRFYSKCGGKPTENFRQGSNMIKFTFFKNHTSYCEESGLQGMQSGSKESDQKAIPTFQVRDNYEVYNLIKFTNNYNTQKNISIITERIKYIGNQRKGHIWTGIKKIIIKGVAYAMYLNTETRKCVFKKM